MKSLEEVQIDLNQAVGDLQQEAGEIQLFDVLGRLVDASDRIGVKFTDEQRDTAVRSLAIRGFAGIKELFQNPDYVHTQEVNPDANERIGIVGNILQCIQDRHTIPQVCATFAFRYRDKLIAEQDAASPEQSPPEEQ
jgi:hypothetical protein